jgi:hypothetical protein
MASILEKMLNTNQHGFLQGRSTQTTTVLLLEAIQDAVKNCKTMQILSIDIKAAFDT